MESVNSTRAFITLGKDEGTIIKRSFLFKSYEFNGDDDYDVELNGECINEAAVLTRLRDCETPHIVRLHNIYIDESTRTMSIVMQKLKHLPMSMPLEKVAKYTRHLFEGLHGMKVAQVAHRDLKPENLMYDPETDELRIIDFGLSVMDLRETIPHNTEVYTKWFRPPELLLNCTRYNVEKAEVWAAGVCVACMLLGRSYVFFGKTTWDVITSIIGGMGGYSQSWEKYTSWDAFHTSFNGTDQYWPEEKRLFELIKDEVALDFVQKCLVLNPEKRATIKELLHHPFINGTEMGKRPNIDVISIHEIEPMLLNAYKTLPLVKTRILTEPIRAPIWLYISEELLELIEYRSLPMLHAGMSLAAIVRCLFISLGHVTKVNVYATLSTCDMVERILKLPNVFKILSSCHVMEDQK